MAWGEAVCAPPVPDTSSATTTPPLHYSDSLLRAPEDAAGGSPAPRNPPRPPGLPLSEAEEEHLFFPLLLSLLLPPAGHTLTHTHPRTPSIYSGIHEATSGEPRGLRKEEEGHSGGLALAACFVKTPKLCRWLGREAAFDKCRGTGQTHVEPGSHTMGDHIFKRAHIWPGKKRPGPGLRA